MIIRGNAIEAELYFDDEDYFVVNVLKPEEVVLPNGKVAYVNKAGEPFIVGADPNQIEQELDQFIEFIQDNSKPRPELSLVEW